MPLPTNKPNLTAEQYKTGSLQETDHFTWNTADVLGRGATATVYFGRHKTSGDACAVKVFYDREWRHQPAMREREIEALRSLDQENVVKLLALERERLSGNGVLVMEYCAGGSVFTMLESPQYSLGFPESEFRLFLTHICNGLNYIRSKGYIHRDIKPGNIMRFVSMDGRSLYKLTDFGAARELQDDETFQSIYGTEEYLHPQMYERAVLRQPGAGNTSFNINVDIWSLGVTIYHVCTGQLPFQPFGGRSNAFTMFEITSKKPCGVISGTQKVQNGQISWNTKLPETCPLSDQLQEFLVPVLAGLMEVNAAKMWPFETFFKHVALLDNMLVMNVFFCGTGQLIQLYVEKTDNISQIQERLAMETELPTVNQLILYRDRDIRDCVDAMAPATSFDRIFFKETLILINRHSMENYSLVLKEQPTFPEMLGYENLDGDAKVAKKAVAISYHYGIEVSATIKKQELLNVSEQMYRKYIRSNVRNFELVLPEIACTVKEVELRLGSFLSNITIFLTLFTALNDLIDKSVIEFSGSGFPNATQILGVIHQIEEYVQDVALKRFFEKILTRLNEINVYTEVLSRKIGDQERERLRMSLGCDDDDNCLSKAEHLKTLITGVSVTMTKHRKYKDLHPHESFIHKCEKDKLQEYMVNIWSLFKEHCTRNLEVTYKSVQREMGNLSKHHLRTTKVEQNIFSVKESLSQLSRKLGENETKVSEMVTKISSLIKSGVTNHSVSSIREATPVSYHSGARVRRTPVGTEAPTKRTNGEENSDSKGWYTPPTSMSVQQPIRSNIRPELSSHSNLVTGSSSAPAAPLSHTKVALESYGKTTSGGYSKLRRERTEMLSLLTEQLTSLQNDSEDLRMLVTENSSLMEKFLNETSNLRIEGSMDSDQRKYSQDDT